MLVDWQRNTRVTTTSHQCECHIAFQDVKVPSDYAAFLCHLHQNLQRTALLHAQTSKSTYRQQNMMAVNMVKTTNKGRFIAVLLSSTNFHLRSVLASLWIKTVVLVFLNNPSLDQKVTICMHFQSSILETSNQCYKLTRSPY